MTEPFMGELRNFGFNWAPRDWLRCEGQLLPISQNTALYTLLGTTYGGDGKTTFGLPTQAGASHGTPTEVATNWCIAVMGIYPMRP